MGRKDESEIDPTKNMTSIEEACREREYVETMLSLRHYSQMRFTVLNVFYVISAGLVIAAFGLPTFDEYSFPEEMAIFFKMFGAFAALIFFLYDVMLDGYQTNFRKYLKVVWPESHWHRRPSYGFFFFLPARLLYISMLALWLLSLSPFGVL